jgi:hypothetical protein
MTENFWVIPFFLFIVYLFVCLIFIEETSNNWLFQGLPTEHNAEKAFCYSPAAGGLRSSGLIAGGVATGA